MKSILYIDAGRGFSCRGFLKALKGLKREHSSYEKRIDKGGRLNAGQAAKSLRAAGLGGVWLKKGEKALALLEGKESLKREGEELSALIQCVCLLAEMGQEEVRVSPLGEGSADREGNLFPGEEILELLADSELSLRILEGSGERLTLCGVSFLRAFARPWESREAWRIEDWAQGEDRGISLRTMLLTRQEPREETGDLVQVLETNVDDCSGEQLGRAIERLMEAGALDASCFPIFMKKNRPAYMLQVICKREKREELEDLIFQETTSIGLRRYEERRRILDRNIEEIFLEGGRRVKIKVCLHHGQRFFYPEYETIRDVCRETGRSYREVYDEAVEEARRQL